MLQGPVWAPRSAPIGGETTDTGPMRDGRIREVHDSLNRSNHGISSLEPGVEAVPMVEPTPVFPRQEASNRINDNYSMFPTKLTPSNQRLNSVVQETSQDLTFLLKFANKMYLV